MGFETTDPKELLKQAIVAEIDGQRFYNFLADKANNKDAKRKLGILAEDEVRHEASLRKMFKRFYNEEVGDLPEQGVGVLAEFFARNRDKEDLSEREYIDLAVQAELAATEYYKQGAKIVPDEESKKIFEGMADEEHRHFEILQAERDSMAGNYYWFSFDENAPLED